MESIRFIGVLLTPFMPETAASIIEQIGSPDASFDSLIFGQGAARKVARQKPCLPDWTKPKRWNGSKRDHRAPNRGGPAEEKPEGVATISIDDFSKTELLVAEVKEVKR